MARFVMHAYVTVKGKPDTIHEMKVGVMVSILLLLGCGAPDEGSNAAGSEGGACYRNGTCDSGLTCASQLCVRISGAAGAGGSGSTGGAGGGQPVRANGELCSAPSQCASGICDKNMVGESRCYGTATANQVCGSVYDCSGGICTPKTLGGTQGVCIPSVNVCLTTGASTECTDFVLAFCELVQSCGANVSATVPARYRTDFDYCIGTECSSVHDGVSDLTPTQCLSGTTTLSSAQPTCP
jgi:hypothetical protein